MKKPSWPSLYERFVRNVDRDHPSGCWIWQGCKNPNGYGVLCVGRGRHGLAHRVSLNYARGTSLFADGMEIDHLCRNRACVNPDHLELVTHAVNMRRGKLAMPTHCKRGHLLEPHTTPGRYRFCRVCHYARTNARRRVTRAAARAARRSHEQENIA